jgi:hypothetical protein
MKRTHQKKAVTGLIAAPVLERRILSIRGQKIILDADLADLYGVTTKALNQAVKRNAQRFPEDFTFVLSSEEKDEVVTNCDHLARLRFSPVHPRVFTEHGALMAANMLNTSRAVAMSVYIIRAFIKMREDLAANAVILRRLAEIDKTLLLHDAALRDIYHKLRPLLEPPPQPPKPQIGFHVREDPAPYRTKRGARAFRPG